MSDATETAKLTANPTSQQPHNSLLQRVEHALTKDGKAALTVMDEIGRDCGLALSAVQSYLPAATALASALFPADAAAISGAANVVNLIQNAVATVEAKWAAGNESGKHGAQKFADVLQLVEGAAIDLLGHLGIQADTNYIGNLVNIVVSILNVRTAQISQTA